LKIGIIDTGTCNVRPLLKAFGKIDMEVGIVKSAQHFSDYDRFVMPGVGSWDSAVESLHSKDLRVDFPGFARHLIALKCKSIGDVYDQQAVHRRIQNRSG